MAALPESDRKKILGDDYRALDERNEAVGLRKNAEEVRAERISKSETSQITAGGIAVVGVILFVTNFYSVSGPSLKLISAFSAMLTVVGVAWYVLLVRKLKALRVPGDHN